MQNTTNWNLLLLFKWIAFNAFMLFLTLLAFKEGYISQVFDNDVSNLSYIIVCVFIACMALIFAKIYTTSLEIRSIGNEYEKSKSSIYFQKSSNKQVILSAFNDNWFRGTKLIQFLTSVPVTLGLIGTIIGFIIMLQGIPTTGATDAASASNLVGVLAMGMGTALYTTLAGAVLSLWLQMNYAIMRSGLTELVTKVTKKEFSDNE